MARKANISWTVKQLVKMIDKGTAHFDNALQRGLVWKDDRKSLLIHSSLTEWMPIPPLYAVRDEDDNKGYSFIDGKQRSNAFAQYIHNEFMLEGIPEVIDEEGNEIDLNGKTFDELPEEMQDRILSQSLTIYYFEDITDDEIAEMMFRLNNGKAMSAIEITRMTAQSKEKIHSISQHEIFKSALTEKALAKYTNEDIVIKSYAVLFEPEPSLLTKDIRPLMKSVDITENQAKIIWTAYDTILEAYKYIMEKESSDHKEQKMYKKAAKRILTRTHLISIVPVAADACSHEYDIYKFAEWLLKFFSGGKHATIDETYNINAGSGSAKSTAVKARLNAIRSSYDTEFDTVEK